MGVVNLPSGRPTLVLTGGAAERLASLTPPGYEARIDLTLTDDFPTAQAIVIISDALRYEIAEELGSRIRQEDRFDADLNAVLGALPSYTQLGMAALLPHRTLKHSADGKIVLADDQPTNGTAARAKILESVGGTAIQAEDFKALSADERRELFKNHRVLYIYHDVIDATGDKDRKSTRLNSSHIPLSRMPSSA